MHRSLLPTVVLISLSGCVTTMRTPGPDAGSATPATSRVGADTETQGEVEAASVPVAFETYQLVLLRRDEAWKEDPTTDLTALQKAHLAHLSAMAEAGHMVAAGPFGDQDDENLRGLCLYRVGSVAEARALAEADPMVQAGRLRVEVMTWYTEAGYVAFPKAPPRSPAAP